MFDFVPWQEGEESPESTERLEWVRSMTDTPSTSKSSLTPSSSSNGQSSEHGVPRGESTSHTSHCDPQDDIDINTTPYPCSSIALDTIPKTETESSPQNLLEHRLRKGYKKSRRGCYNCKRRKIKCQENHPACHNCVKIKAACEYPSLDKQNQRVKVVYSVQDPVECLLANSRLQSAPTIFKASDMRLFHHFIMTAYPHLPLGNGDVWVRDIPAFAHSYDFLLQAILALAASHLTMTTTSNLSFTALNYRILAIHNLNLALARTPSSAEESDAILATCYALAFQTSYIGESIEEFLTLLRGCVLISTQEWRKLFGTRFTHYEINGHEEVLSEGLRSLPLLDAGMVSEAQNALKKIEHIVLSQDDEVVREVWRYLVEVLELCLVCCHDAYMRNRDLHIYLSTLSTPSFQTFISPNNAPAQLILAHFIAVHTLMAPIKVIEFAGRSMPRVNPNRRTMFFVAPILERIPKEWVEEGLMEYPLQATGCVQGMPGLLERGFGERWHKTPMLGGGRMEERATVEKVCLEDAGWTSRVHERATAYIELTGLEKKDSRSEGLYMELKGLGKKDQGSEGFCAVEEDWDGSVEYY